MVCAYFSPAARISISSELPVRSGLLHSSYSADELMCDSYHSREIKPELN